MIVDFDKIANDSRIWIFQANRIFLKPELEFLEKSILRPNNINFPLSRVEFGKLIK